MCGIIVSASKSKTCFLDQDKLNKRGPDQTKEWISNDIRFSFHRLAIMDLDESGMQPFIANNCTLVANAEIYNYKTLKSKYFNFQYKGTSDCEVLIPMYKKLGVRMFKELDAEFALVLYDKETKSLIAARDPIGIRPLFYGFNVQDNKIMFASEAKALINVVKKVFPFPPGHFYKNGIFKKYHNIFDVCEYNSHSELKIFNNIKSKLINGVLKRLTSDAPMGFLLSGGLDSSLVCSIAARALKKPIRTFSIGMDLDPIDLKYARQVAKYIGSIHTEVKITKQDVINSLAEIIYTLETYDITTIRASIGMYQLSKYINDNTDIKVLLTGEVSDELFGYKYTDFSPNAEAFQKESLKRMHELYMYDVLRADRCLAANSLEARVPFADLDFVNYVLRISPTYKMNNFHMGKYLLRQAFAGDYLPKSILYRDKAAFSDAVGHSLVDCLKEYANKIYSDQEFKEKALVFKPTPISKEALLYREIFEKYYPNHSHLIKDYWMPNTKWIGCNVNDPSARVLSNYGDSGK